MVNPLIIQDIVKSHHHPANHPPNIDEEANAALIIAINYNMERANVNQQGRVSDTRLTRMGIRSRWNGVRGGIS